MPFGPTLQGMSSVDLLLALLAVNAAVYTYIVAKQGESIVRGLAAGLLLGPFVWIGWLAGRAADRRAEASERRG